MGDQEDPRQRVWRAGRGLRVAAAIAAIVVVLVGLLIVAGSGVPVAARGLLALLFGAIAWFVWWTTVRPRLVADDAGLVVVGLFRHSTVGWEEVEDVVTRRGGLLITTLDGRRLGSRHPQESPVGRAVREVTVADEAVAYIRERAAVARGP